MPYQQAVSFVLGDSVNGDVVLVDSFSTSFHFAILNGQGKVSIKTLQHTWILDYWDYVRSLGFPKYVILTDPRSQILWKTRDPLSERYDLVLTLPGRVSGQESEILIFRLKQSG